MNVSKLNLITKHFVNGQFVNSLKGKTFDVINPNDETVLATMQKGTKEDIDAAIIAARDAFEKGPWARMDASERGRCLYRLADLIEKNASSLAEV